MPALSCIELTRVEQQLAIDMVWLVLRESIKEQQLVMPAVPDCAVLQQQAGCFITLYVDDELRGCIGTSVAEKPLWQNICNHSYNSAFKDYRFDSLQFSELKQLSFQISILSACSSIDNLGEQALVSELKPGVDGLVIEYQQHNALFLPSVWDALPKPEVFVAKLKVKAGLAEDYWHQDMKLYRFQTLLIKSAS
ncbi:hypothetical protein A9Q98_12945 [Thalassotalea sp. 42_200_T64]|nr:hypothetical protein A9Q98_12945 [Thalassotalea sp. 42_200_T64]